VQRVAGGTSTYSKIRTIPHYPDRVVSASGAHVMAEGGVRLGRYLDYTSALGAVLLGYNDPAVTRALTGVLDAGTINCGLPIRLEEETAELLCAATGWDQARFAKNGSDVTEAAVRLARYRHRQRAWSVGPGAVVTNGYHGSHSDLVAATPGKDGGVLDAAQRGLLPVESAAECLRLITDGCQDGQVAAVIAEPHRPSHTTPWPWQEIKDTCERAGALLIFDEVLTGFRMGLGGYAAVCGVRPHLACYSKALGNGVPIAAIAGPRALMLEFETHVFLSGTYATEGLGLAAAWAVLSALQNGADWASLRDHGTALQAALRGVGLTVRGDPTRTQILFETPEQQIHFWSGMAQRGILLGPDIFPTFAHTAEDSDRFAAAAEEVMHARMP
jgi:glutamate-1-semialdehyde 2,1-aminomutase